MSREDTEPWHRQFWPWFLIVLPGTVVIAALSTVYIAVRHADDLVMEDYYKTGLAINRQLEKQRIATDRSLVAELSVLDRRLQLRIAGLDGMPALRLRLFHPLEADRDFSVTLQASAPGLYVVALPAPVAPNWHWALDDGADSKWQLDGSLASSDFLDDRSD